MVEKQNLCLSWSEIGLLSADARTNELIAEHVHKILVTTGQ